eukprot:TRINITY_DN10860_c0_g6_i1.p1 TRINITY_DN10860_c0_g6~~TRINITY_DN10860_c0_g6_i1.p1  ORF type:complete len:459 (-),score=103.68 TRINITY_DN10860_c0_g6_i1:522-1898(-)
MAAIPLDSPRSDGGFAQKKDTSTRLAEEIASANSRAGNAPRTPPESRILQDALVASLKKDSRPLVGQYIHEAPLSARGPAAPKATSSLAAAGHLMSGARPKEAALAPQPSSIISRSVSPRQAVPERAPISRPAAGLIARSGAEEDQSVKLDRYAYRHRDREATEGREETRQPHLRAQQAAVLLSPQWNPDNRSGRMSRGTDDDEGIAMGRPGRMSRGTDEDEVAARGWNGGRLSRGTDDEEVMARGQFAMKPLQVDRNEKDVEKVRRAYEQQLEELRFELEREQRRAEALRRRNGELDRRILGERRRVADAEGLRQHLQEFQEEAARHEAQAAISKSQLLHSRSELEAATRQTTLLRSECLQAEQNLHQCRKVAAQSAEAEMLQQQAFQRSVEVAEAEKAEMRETFLSMQNLISRAREEFAELSGKVELMRPSEDSRVSAVTAKAALLPRTGSKIRRL